MASNMTFHNNTVALHDLFYESNLNVLKRVCLELGKADKVEELHAKILGDKHKFKACKDKNAPKRGKSSFMFFCDEKRPSILKKLRKNNKKIVVGEVAKQLGSEWKKLNEKSRKPYCAQAAKDKKRYQTAKAKYDEKHML